MLELFPIKLNLPDGFNYYREFLTIDEENQLLKAIKNIDLHTFMFQGYEAKRKVASFGFDYNFTNRSIKKGNPIPGEFTWLIEKVSRHFDLPDNAFKELLVTEYPVGSVINWHRDAPPFELIAGISLNSNCTFKLRPYDKAKQNRKSVISLPVERRSLYKISGVAREQWEHSTAPVDEVRYSITLRTLKVV